MCTQRHDFPSFFAPEKWQQFYDDNESTLVVAVTESADPSLFSLSIELQKHKLTSKSLALSTYTHIKLEKRVEMSPVLILPRRGMDISLLLRAELKSIWIFFRGGWRFNNNPCSIFYDLSDGQSINKFMMIPSIYRNKVCENHRVMCKQTFAQGSEM